MICLPYWAIAQVNSFEGLSDGDTLYTTNDRRSRPVTWVKKKQYSLLLKRRGEVKQEEVATEAMQNKLDSLLLQAERIQQLVEQLEQQGNDFSDSVEVFGNQVVKHGLKSDRTRKRMKRERKEIKESVQPEKKVVKRGKEMSKVGRIHRIVDGVMKTILAVLP